MQGCKQKYHIKNVEITDNFTQPHMLKRVIGQFTDKQFHCQIWTVYL